MNEQLEFAKLIATRLDSARIPYMMTGSMAMAIYAVPRMTRDVDLVIECAPADSDRVAALFEKDCYADRKSIRAATESRAAFNIIHTLWMVKADFIVRKNEPYREVEFGRRLRLDIDGVSISVVAPEDLHEEHQACVTDTPPEVEIRYRDLIMALTPGERLAMASRMFDTARALALAGISARLGKDATEQDLRVELFLRFYGKDLAPRELQRIVSDLRKR